MMKIGWLAANQKQRKIGHWSNMTAKNLQYRPAIGKEGPAALNNKKQDNFDPIHTHNVVKQNGVSIYRKNKNSVWGVTEKFKNLRKPFKGRW